MHTPDDGAPATFTIGGREVSTLMAALIAQEADRLGIPPGKVGDLVLPEPGPTHVLIAGFRLSLVAGAEIAREADARGMHLRKVIAFILAKQTALNRRARPRS